MENLTIQLATMETISRLRADLTDKIMSLVEQNNLLGEYKIDTPFEVADGNFTYAFEVEWCDHLHHEDGKTIYFYIQDIEGEQVDGEFMWDINILPLDYFYRNVLLNNSFKLWY
jgi:hypothetical protein